MTVPVSSVNPPTPTVFSPYYEQNVPHAVVMIDGTAYIPVSYHITFNAHGATDDATVTLTISNNPDFTLNLYQWSALPDGSALPSIPIFMEIWAGFRDTPAPTTDLSGLTQRFLGILDSYSMNPDADEVTFTCRSLASPFVDQKLTSAPMGMTSVDFVQKLANGIGLKTNIALVKGVKPITIQETLGREFISGGANFNASVFNLHPWDLFLQTALFDDVDVWVDRDTLNYIAPSLVKRTTVNLQYGGDGTSPGILRPVGTHSAQLNKNIRVEVRTWMKKTNQSTVYRVDSASGGVIVQPNSRSTYRTSTPVFGTNSTVSTSISSTGAQSTSISSGSGGGFSGTTTAASESGKMIYKVFRPNLTPARCNQLALSLWRQYSMHEFALSFDLPVTMARLADFSITSLLRVSGLPYDQFNTHDKSDMYYPRQIVESFDASSGWVWSVQCVNAVLPSGGV
jgi:hypothetical protein